MTDAAEKQDDGSATEHHAFQTEAKQLLKLMIHSLYSNSEIFLRELVSNASDAIDKLRFEAIKDESLYGDDPNLEIRVTFDEDAGTVTISDNGIGMGRQEVIDNLGTIARSGTAAFMEQLTGDAKKDAALIGQFGVGFYSAFIVADSVDVITRRAGAAADEAVHWSSRGEAEYTLEPASRDARGTDVVLHLKAEHKDFADGWRLRSIIRKYSDHLAVPVLMVKEAAPVGEDEEPPADDAPVDWETVNQARALWTRNRTDIEDDEYKEFYRHVSHDFEEPLAWMHNRVEGKQEYTSLLYIPKKAPFDLYNRESPRGVKLYVQRVFIMDDAEQFLPLYLRFIRGVLDSNDLPLNVSREILQQDGRVESIRNALTKRVLDTLKKLAKNEPEQFQAFWDEFGQVLKEGPAEDFGNREAIAGLLRFATTHTGKATQDQSLAEVVGRMAEGQDAIYYLCAESHAMAAQSPHLEAFRDKGIEVLLLSDRIDEWVMTSLREFDGKQLVDITRGDIDLDGTGKDAEDKADEPEVSEEHKALLERVKAALGDRVEDVKASRRLRESPCVLAVGEHDMNAQMRRILEQAGQAVPESKPILELNMQHPLVTRLGSEEGQRFEDLAGLLLDQATLADGGTLEDPGTFAARLNRLLLELAG